MAKLIIEFPDAAIPDVKEAFGGGTNTEVIESACAALLNYLRLQTNERRLAQHRAADIELYKGAEAIERDRLEAIWIIEVPVEV